MVHSRLALILASIALGPRVLGDVLPDDRGKVAPGLWALIGIFVLMDLALTWRSPRSRRHANGRVALAAGCGLMALSHITSIAAIGTASRVAAGVLIAISCVYVWRDARESF